MKTHISLNLYSEFSVNKPFIVITKLITILVNLLYNYQNLDVVLPEDFTLSELMGQ